MLTLFSYDATHQSWKTIPNLQIVSFGNDGCTLVQEGTLVRVDDVKMVAADRRNAACFAAAYSTGTARYNAFLRRMGGTVVHPQLRSIRPRMCPDGLPTVQFAAENEGGGAYIVYSSSSFAERPVYALQDNCSTKPLESRRPICCEPAMRDGWLDAFSHDSFERSHRRLVVTADVINASGLIEAFTIDTDSDEFHGTEDWPFGGYNGGVPAVEAFKSSHHCNQFCRFLKLCPL